MMRLTLMLLAVLGVTGTASAAEYFYDHNGSLMRVVTDGPDVFIYYEKPRKGLGGVGVRSGTLLFDGGKDGPNYIAGMSRIFNANCGEIGYYVYGDFVPGRAFTLTGAAPVVSGMSCRIVDNVYEGDNANLVFTPAANASPALVDPQPQLSALDFGDAAVCVTGVQSFLNVRVGPGSDYSAIGQLPANVCGVAKYDTCQGQWCVVEHGSVLGWVHVDYLRVLHGHATPSF